MIGGFVCNQNGLYKITSAARQNLALDACRDKDKLNKLIIYDYYGGPNQKFFISPCQNNTFAIFCVFNNGTVEVPASSKSDGAQVEVNEPNNTPNEKWNIVPVQGKNGVYEIISFCGKALDIEGQKLHNGTNVIQWTRHGKINQQWHIELIQ